MGEKQWRATITTTRKRGRRKTAAARARRRGTRTSHTILNCHVDDDNNNVRVSSTNQEWHAQPREAWQLEGEPLQQQQQQEQQLQRDRQEQKEHQQSHEEAPKARQAQQEGEKEHHKQHRKKLACGATKKHFPSHAERKCKSKHTYKINSFHYVYILLYIFIDFFAFSRPAHKCHCICTLASQFEQWLVMHYGNMKTMAAYGNPCHLSMRQCMRTSFLQGTLSLNMMGVTLMVLSAIIMNLTWRILSKPIAKRRKPVVCVALLCRMWEKTHEG